MILPVPSVAVTITMLTTPGSMCRIIIRVFEAPATRASDTYSRLLSDSVSALTSRTAPGHEIIAKTPIRVQSPCPKTKTTTKMISKPGRMFHASTIRITTSSTIPPKKPDTRPIVVPTIMPVPTAATTTRTVTRAPAMILLRMSRPKASVPRT